MAKYHVPFPAARSRDILKNTLILPIMALLNLRTPVKELSRVGQSTASRLKNLNIATAGDLLWHLPFRYDDLSQITTIDKAGGPDVITVKARVELLQNRRSPRKKVMITEGIISDASGSLKVVWFNQPFITKNLATGDEVYFSGKIEEDRFGRCLKNPTYEKIREQQTSTACIVPVYPATENITQKQLRFLIQMVLPLAEKIQDWLPQEVTKKFNFLSLSESWKQIHFPETQQKLNQAIHRLKFNELFLIQMHNMRLKNELEKISAPEIPFHEEQIKKLVSSLPFQLTPDQRRSAWQIIQDMQRHHPMNRMLEGDVGCGKTVVAALAMYNTVLNQFQAALMAPTEILAFQHWQTINTLFDPKEIHIALLTNNYGLSNQPVAAPSRAKLQEELKKGNIQMIIGTHSLIQENVIFENLGLAIIDEQHRFGVEQRRHLKSSSGDKNRSPHFLSMTATPIPRSLALALYGDLDISHIKQKPANRKAIRTSLVRSDQRTITYKFIETEIKKGRQAFVICPLIEESDTLGVKSVNEEHKKLQTHIFPHLRIGLLHGKMKGSEKETIMTDFKDKKYHVLVATSVIEVGVDVPNASIMIIEGSERFGLAQLHQFRGRVGRDEHQSYCFLFTENFNPAIVRRLSLLAEHNDGFSLAEADLKLRGPGDVYGTEQSGWVNLKIANWHDTEIMRETKSTAESLFRQDPKLLTWPLLARKVERFSHRIHLE